MVANHVVQSPCPCKAFPLHPITHLPAIIFLSQAVCLSFHGKDLRFVEALEDVSDMFDLPEFNDALKKNMATILEMPLKPDMDYLKQIVPIAEGQVW